MIIKHGRNSQGVQRYVGFSFPYLSFLGGDWLGRHALVTQMQIALDKQFLFRLLKHAQLYILRKYNKLFTNPHDRTI